MTDASYRVLARKYRPATFADMIGQDALVRTLTNAIKTGRLAHAYLLTGIRGVGKTTTARIIARALNCIGPDGNGGPTPNPCGVCPNCIAIAEDRHVDVLEMDAASRTGVGDIRELIDTVRYLPTSARYKIYIIDEVHMLSTSAFNALLKTLEEPPPHVKFIFATTELRKIPVTILSRCQRFDLKRVDIDTLSAYLTLIAGKENIAAEPEALRLLSVAGEGSVRDSLSLLDQAAAHAASEEATHTVTANLVRDMLGLADKSQSFELIEPLLQGDAPKALTVMLQLYENGADPVMLLQDLLELTHFITRLKLVPALAAHLDFPETDRVRGAALAEGLSLAVLSRLWQMLLKGLGETRTSPSPLTALEMVLVRIAYAADMPTPAELVKTIQHEGAPPASSAPRGGSGKSFHVGSDGAPSMAAAVTLPPATSVQGNLAMAVEASAMVRPALQLVEPEKADPQSFEELVALFAARREVLLYTYLKTKVTLVRLARGTLEVASSDTLPADFTRRVSACLKAWTGEEWNVSLSKAGGGATLAQQETQAREQALAAAAAHPAVAEVLAHFPGAKVVDIVARDKKD